MDNSPPPRIVDAERDFSDATREWRRLVAEFWGTLLLVAVATGAEITSRATHLSPAEAAAAPGLMVMAAIYFMGSVSGAHLNPAVTFAFALRRNFPWKRAPGYIAAQLLGAVVAAYGVHALIGGEDNYGATIPHLGISPFNALALETLLTAGLINTILGTASGARNVGTNAGIAVGGYVALAGVWASQWTGASMNPARTLGPDLVRGDFGTTWIYLVGAIAGAALGVLLERLMVGPPTVSGAAAAQGETSRR